MAWLTGWNYRKSVTISNTGSTLSDYQMSIIVDTASLVTTGKLLSNCNDIRFTDTDGSTLLNYWIESGCNTVSTKIWVKVPSIPSGTKTIYIYYNNLSASSVSSGANTFDIFDDFEYSDSITNHGWTIVEDNPITSTVMAKSGSRSLRTQGYGGNLSGTEDVAGMSFSSRTGIIEVWLYDNGIDASIQRTIMDGTGAGFHLGINRQDIATYYAYWDGSWRSTGIVRSIGWHLLKISIKATGLDASIDGTSVTTNNACLTAFTNLTVAGHRLRPSTGYWDDFRIRKYISPEPTFGTIGTEEQFTGSLDISSVPTGANIYIDDVLQIGITTHAIITGLAPGSHGYRLTLSGYADFTDTFTIIAGSTTTISVTLVAIGCISPVCNFAVT